ncbi:YicC/YloC family endoribonuclease [Parabacteroides sp. FAFU027]|uniref:YicC/YloC family endoribonuclease n=1 Tax=Parabacteroides sp. FAFU027 TaxID=2922715 RepID=UPI001FAFA38A|nr:YicC/YloC family endoribonuclease [Parabacteroides sp. FAFU027]
MILSMTGFGKAVAEFPTKRVTVEVKSLNSKQLDLSTRIPGLYREKEMEIRNELSQLIERGKVDFSIYIENLGKESSTQINASVVDSYIKQISNIAENSGVALPADWFSVVLRLPEALKTEIQELDEEEWKGVHDAIVRAAKQLIDFRKQEGAGLQTLLGQKIEAISSLLKEVDNYEGERIERVKTRLAEGLAKLENVDYDRNRFEQELIFYIEKLDVNEEKHRLAHHLKYFLETMDHTHGQGKKLGFISQEIGREINTLGSKSNHAEMQKIVVRMKDELEQIKEQVLNVL